MNPVLQFGGVLLAIFWFCNSQAVYLSPLQVRAEDGTPLHRGGPWYFHLAMGMNVASYLNVVAFSILIAWRLSSIIPIVTLVGAWGASHALTYLFRSSFLTFLPVNFRLSYLALPVFGVYLWLVLLPLLAKPA